MYQITYFLVFSTLGFKGHLPRGVSCGWTLKVLHCIGRTQVCIISQPIDWCHVSCMSLPAVGWYPMCRTLTVKLQVFQYLLVWHLSVFGRGLTDIWVFTSLRWGEEKMSCERIQISLDSLIGQLRPGMLYIFVRENRPPWTMTRPLKTFPTDTQVGDEPQATWRTETGGGITSSGIHGFFRATCLLRSYQWQGDEWHRF